ncbi:MAG TPA: diguanylate cyclase [Geobacteraceae bacterium]|nr:diguanylate cyclase [Geobacteraceae bacterium]
MSERRSSNKPDFPILIADDNDLQRTVLEYVLRKAGHEVTVAEDGRKAVEIFTSGYYPIVITDWMMPNMTGLELCRTIRENYQDQFTYVILHSSRDGRDDVQTAMEAGIDEYLVKPAAPEELALRLATAHRVLKLEQALKRKLEEARQLATTDSLTRLYNRGFLDERLPLEVKRAIRYDRPLSIIFSDIDHFKTINDSYGHRTGDEVLKSFARRIKENVRDEVDWLARYGGEEFVLILPETDIEGAMIVANRLQRVVASTPIAVDAAEIGITASFGAASFSPTGNIDARTMAMELLGRADRCLYAAKEGGRNRCEGARLN